MLLEREQLEKHEEPWISAIRGLDTHHPGISRRTVQPGQVVYRGANLAESFFLLLDGTVEIYQSDENGESGLIELIAAPSLLGEAAFDPNREVYTTTAITITQSEIICIPANELSELIKKHPELVEVIGAAFASRTRAAMSRIEGFKLDIPDQISLAEEALRIHGVKRVTQRKIGEMLGIVREWIYKNKRRQHDNLNLPIERYRNGTTPNHSNNKKGRLIFFADWQSAQRPTGKERIEATLDTFVCDAPSGVILQKIKRGRTVYHAGDRAESILLVREGIVKVLGHDNSKSATLQILRAPSYLGETAFDERLHTTSAQAMTDCSIIRIAKKSLPQLLSTNPQFADIFLQLMLQRIGSLEQRLSNQAFADVFSRTTHALRELQPVESEGFPVFQQEIADTAWVSRQEVNKHLTRALDHARVT